MYAYSISCTPAPPSPLPPDALQSSTFPNLHPSFGGAPRANRIPFSGGGWWRARRRSGVGEQGYCRVAELITFILPMVG